MSLISQLVAISSSVFKLKNHFILTFYFQVCPICASLPGGDPNHVTDDFAAHLTLEHRAPREFISFVISNIMYILFIHMIRIVARGSEPHGGKLSLNNSHIQI